MKIKTLIIAISSLAVFSMGVNAKITISGKSKQTVNVDGGTVMNQASGSESIAKQSLASNKGNVTISGKSTQTVNVDGGTVMNQATGSKSIAEQSLASNIGD